MISRLCAPMGLPIPVLYCFQFCLAFNMSVWQCTCLDVQNLHLQGISNVWWIVQLILCAVAMMWSRLPSCTNRASWQTLVWLTQGVGRSTMISTILKSVMEHFAWQRLQLYTMFQEWFYSLPRAMCNATTRKKIMMVLHHNCLHLCIPDHHTLFSWVTDQLLVLSIYWLNDCLASWLDVLIDWLIN